jgi:hypothetical protein
MRDSVKIYAVCFALFFCIACASSSDAAAGGASYIIISKVSGMCIDVPASSMEEGRQLIVWSIHNNKPPHPNQVWILEEAGSEGEYRILSEQSKMYLSVQDASLENLAPVVQLPAAPAGTSLDEDSDEGEAELSADHQIWKFVRQGGHYTIVSKLSSMPLTVSGFSAERGAFLVQFEALQKADNQAFKLRRVRTP